MFSLLRFMLLKVEHCVARGDDGTLDPNRHLTSSIILVWVSHI